MRAIDFTYAHKGLTESVRQYLRACDAAILMLALVCREQLPRLNLLRTFALLELGPGPTRLARLKRRYFRRVCFVDKTDFGLQDFDLHRCDLEKCSDINHLAHKICNIPSDQLILVTGDHCLEHLPQNVLAVLFETISSSGHSACFRVPNVLSPHGQYNYSRDSTHQSAFDAAFRAYLSQLGFAVLPWVRWYRIADMAEILLLRRPLMSVAEEIVICKA
jgi:hypothetical protein